MFWPSPEESVTVNGGAKTHNMFQASMFGLKPVVLDLSVSVDDAQKAQLVCAVAAVTSHFVQQFVKMAVNLNQSGVALQKLACQPMASEIALWKHHESVG
uniref:Uncharacterized protein n=1 Tax=Haliotis diversicolor TaxID=36095 RepID=B3TK35_HALDV|nr:unknown protein 5 [Haliotis diversicolor]